MNRPDRPRLPTVFLASLAVTTTLFTSCAALRERSTEKGPQAIPERHVEKIPHDLRARLALTSFYAKLVDVDGFPVVSSAKVSDAALLEAAYLIDRMLHRRRDLLDAMAKNKVRFVVMAAGEMTTSVPEHSDLQPGPWWDRRARGLGATDERPAVSCGEENLLRFPGDPYAAENVLVHELAHAIHEIGLDAIDENFDRRLRGIYRRAMKRGLWKGKYAASNRKEYWAEGVQSYFDTKRPPDHDHNFVDTRVELEKYDPELFRIVDEVFRKSEWRYRRPENRRGTVGVAHLEGYVREKAPRFAWPRGLEAKYRAFDAERRRDPVEWRRKYLGIEPEDPASDAKTRRSK